MRKYLLLLLISVCMTMSSSASHLIGGQLYYDYIGNNLYRITFLRYLNCNCPSNFTCPSIEDSVFIHFFDSTGVYLLQYKVLKLQGSDTLISAGSTSCKALCIQKGIYSDTVRLPALQGGYTMVYQRCCRNPAISNIAVNSGSTYYTHLPDPGSSMGHNSSPRFDSIIPSVIPIDTLFSFEHRATDPDGDSLVYSLADVIDGADATCTDPNPNSGASQCPTMPSSPPYISVAYGNPYNGMNPMNSPSDNGNLRVDATTGRIYGVPNQQGIFAVAVRVDEIRSGVIIGSTYEDFQITTELCTAPLAVAEQKALDNIKVSLSNTVLRINAEDVRDQKLHVAVYDLLGQQLSDEMFNTPGIYDYDMKGMAAQYVIVKVSGINIAGQTKRFFLSGE